LTVNRKVNFQLRYHNLFVSSHSVSNKGCEVRVQMFRLDEPPPPPPAN